MTEVTSIHAARNPDNVLESAKGVFKEVMVIGYTEDDILDIRVSTDLSHESILFMMELFKHGLMAGLYDEGDEDD